jgi:hypothetical protein
MSFLLIGGSNTGKVDGYYQAMTSHFGADKIRNRFLGASTSLYGLAAMEMHLESDSPDHLIFEYALNDISYDIDGLYSRDLLRWVLQKVCHKAKDAGSSLTFLLMCPRYNLTTRNGGNCFVTNLYKDVAQDYGFPSLDVTDLLISNDQGKKLESFYADDMHYTTSASRKIGEWLCDHLEASSSIQPSKPSVHNGRMFHEDLVILPVTKMDHQGEVEKVSVATSAIKTTSIRLKRNSTLSFQFEGEVLGLITNTTQHTGFVRIKSGQRQIIKNMFDGFYKENADRVFLKQFNEPFTVCPGEQVNISTDVFRGEIAAGMAEVTKHERPPISSEDFWGCDVIAAVCRHGTSAQMSQGVALKTLDVTQNLNPVPVLVKLPFNKTREAWYLVDSGRLRRITRPDDLKYFREIYATDDGTRFVHLPRGPIVPSPNLAENSNTPPIDLSVGRMREFVVSSLRGTGYEFGAGGRPLPLPIGCNVKYADRFSNAEMSHLSSASHGTIADDFLPLDVVDTLEDMETIPDESANFIVACHVIEHVRNPIKAIVSGFKKLRPGGKLVLIAPDKERTHDRHREPTSTSHLLADYISPSQTRDLEHYIDKYTKVERTSLSDLSYIMNMFTEQRDIHLHVFTYKSFLQMLSISQYFAPFRNLWSSDGRIADPKAKEMYFILTK